MEGDLSLIVERTEGPTAAVGVWVRSGSAHEAVQEAGMTHLLEHLLLRRCGDRTPEAIAELVDSLGGNVNAYTTREACAVVAHVPATRRQEALDLLLDAMFFPSFNDEDVALEQRVVAAEFDLYRDSPGETAAEKALVACWGEHPLARPILGDAQVVMNLSRSALLAFHQSRFGRNRALLVAVGPWDEGELADRLAVMPRAANGQVILPPPAWQSRLVVEERDSLEQVYVHLVFPGLAQDDPQLPVLEVLTQLLGGGPASRLFRQLRDRLGLVYEVGSGLLVTQVAGALEVSFSAPAARGRQAWEALLGVLEEVAGGRLEDREVELAKKALLASIVLGASSPDALLEAHAGEFLSRNRRFSQQELEREIGQVSAQEVRAMACKVLDPSLLAGAVCGPRGQVWVPPFLVGRIR
ncbi:MAG: insulinase family protein [Thermoanaerobaculum sp.]|nr:insulinase family protein [Thermoanaerobaculum sp.]MDW7968445.1 pitrilysin family protein [Thermoanaerobaculum sp.]